MKRSEQLQRQMVRNIPHLRRVKYLELNFKLKPMTNISLCLFLRFRKYDLKFSHYLMKSKLKSVNTRRYAPPDTETYDKHQ